MLLLAVFLEIATLGTGRSIEGSLLLWQLRTTLLTTQSFVEREESGGEILKRSVEGRIRSNCSMLLEEIRGLGMMVLWMMACMARMLLLLLPHALPLPLLIPMLQKLSVHAEEAAATLVTTQSSRLDPYVAADGWSLTLNSNSSSSSPIGRALSQVIILPAAAAKFQLFNILPQFSFFLIFVLSDVEQVRMDSGFVCAAQLLELLNRVPASSSKYEFLLSLTDKVIEENKIHGVGYKSVTRTALGVGFARTINRLGRSLEGQRHQGLWLWRFLPSSDVLLPKIGFPAPLVKLQSIARNMLITFSPWPLLTPTNRILGIDYDSSSSSSSASCANTTDSEMAEKLAQELLWMAQKLLDCGAMEEAVQQWSSVPTLAELSLCASPRVQKSLVRLSALLCRELAGESQVSHGVRLKLVLLWLPLLCNATHGGDGPIFTSLEKTDAERLLESAILCMSVSDQELILSTWLQEYALSQSDWPNLQNCYNVWRQETRKLECQVRDQITT
jgi:hypothetical protein